LGRMSVRAVHVDGREATQHGRNDQQQPALESRRARPGDRRPAASPVIRRRARRKSWPRGAQ
jgi:hypothetical protein